MMYFYFPHYSRPIKTKKWNSLNRGFCFASLTYMRYSRMLPRGLFGVITGKKRELVSNAHLVQLRLQSSVSKTVSHMKVLKIQTETEPETFRPSPPLLFSHMAEPLICTFI